MQFKATTLSTLAVALLANDVIAASHGRHQAYHDKRDVVYREIVETNTETVYITVDYEDGRTLGVQTVGAAPTPAAAPAAAPVVAVQQAPAAGVGQAQSSSTTTTPAPVASAAAVIDNIVKAATPTTLVPVVATTPAKTSYVSSKKGLLVGNVSPAAAFVKAASWCWNWMSTSGACPAGVEFVPQMWGEGYGRENSWAGDAQKAIDNGAKVLMAFNEPELAAQANMPDPNVCADKYKQYMQPFAGKAKLCSPSVTDDNSPGHGLSYMKDFLAAAKTKGLTVDLLCIHIYKTYDAVSYFKQQLIDAYALTGNSTNIWVTEWGVTNGSDDQKAAYMKEAIAFMDAQPWIERQSYFYVANDVLATGAGLPTTLGNVYIAAN